MKKTIITAAVLLLGMSFGQAAMALQWGQQPPRDRDPTPVDPVFGTFKARLKQLDPHYGPDGRYYTYSYHEISGPTMASCEWQVASWLTNGNVSVVEYCHLVN